MPEALLSHDRQEQAPMEQPAEELTVPVDMDRKVVLTLPFEYFKKLRDSQLSIWQDTGVETMPNYTQAVMFLLDCYGAVRQMQQQEVQANAEKQT